ncbi:hypothetical protein LO771_22935 [Streptacidiphilus sp. ASG 303]|uniref:hypothetical protein n=1 Tax=Streptacidiphilus sp. ASG 303 TaxID=2896847 RepID=UPI001E410304|nr:hypothetical protein [Streptacidiphilus sp. ASG 303]MCD0485159.1 hypothetical protein [Streptacidiphilus sp. ASG 303]
MTATCTVERGCATQARDLLAGHRPTLPEQGPATDGSATVRHAEDEHGPFSGGIVARADPTRPPGPHHRGLRREGLVAGDRRRGWYGEDRSAPFVLEVARRYDQQGPGAAYRNDAVSAIGQDAFRSAEGRGGRPAGAWL